MSRGWGLAAILVATLCRPAAAETLDELRRLWQAGQYETVLPGLTAYRESAAYGRDPEVDYMIGTACCRLADREDLGRKFLRWVLYSYTLDAQQRDVVGRELAACDGHAAPVQVSFVNVRAGGGTVGVRGKTFYYAGAENALLTSDPVRVIREVSRAELDARLLPLDAPDAAERAKARLSPGATAIQAGRFTIASRVGYGPDELRKMGDALQSYADKFVATYGLALPDRLVTIYLVSTPRDLQALADSLHGLHVSSMSLGYSFRDDLSIVAAVPLTPPALRHGPPGTVAHELMHLLARRNFGDIPSWLDEGMAALVETSDMRGDEVVGLPNWRGPVLKKLWPLRPSVEKLVRMSWQSFDDVEGRGENPEPRAQAANHAMARYLMLYLQSRHLLVPVYAAFRVRKVAEMGDDPPAASVRLLERVTGEPLADLDRHFAAWFDGVPLH